MPRTALRSWCSSYCAPARCFPPELRTGSGLCALTAMSRVSGTAFRRCVLDLQRRAPGAGGRRRDLGEPGIRRPLVPVGRFGRDAFHRARSATACPRPAFSAMTMTRSGAPVQGASGDGKTVTSAASAQLSDAAAAADPATEKNPPAISVNAVVAAAMRRPRSIWIYTLLKFPELRSASQWSDDKIPNRKGRVIVCFRQ